MINGVQNLIAPNRDFTIKGLDTQDRDDAGAFGIGITSGFYQTLNSLNCPVGATSWWQLSVIDIVMLETIIQCNFQEVFLTKSYISGK